MLNQKERRALALMLWLPLVGWLVSTTTVNALPHSAWETATEPVAVKEMRELLPQGWAFFTRDAQEPRVSVYRYVDGQWTSAEAPPNNSPRYWFGLNRGARPHASEVGFISAGVAGTDWAECGRGDHVACLASLAPVPGLVVENSGTRPTVCGTVGLVVQDPVPWAWRNSDEPVRMPLSGVVVEVTCKR